LVYHRYDAFRRHEEAVKASALWAMDIEIQNTLVAFKQDQQTARGTYKDFEKEVNNLDLFPVKISSEQILK